MTSNIFLFYGEENYLLDKEVLRRKQGFIQKFGSDSIFSFNSENFETDRIKQSIFGGGLFVNKKMIIINGLPTDTSNKISTQITESISEDIITKYEQIGQDTLLIFVSNKPDKRSRLYKFLEKTCTIKSFERLSNIELTNFIKTQLNGLQINNQTIEYMIIKIGNNLYNITSECNKLQTRCQIKSINTITQEIIDLVCFGQTETNNFAFFDNFLDNPDQNISIIDQIKSEGTDRNYFISALYSGIKSYIYILDLYNQGITDAKTISSITKLHRYAVSQNIKKINKIKEKSLKIKKFYEGIIRLDNNIKSGKLPDTYFRLGIKKLILASK